MSFPLMNEVDAPNSGSQRIPMALAALLVILVAWAVRFRLLTVPLERDEGEFAYVGQLMLDGGALFTEVHSLKLPGTAGAYALFMSMFGQTTIGIHLGLLVVNCASTVLLYLLARRLLGRGCDWFAAASFAAMSVSTAVLGVYAHATHFVVLFTLAGLLLLLRAADRESRALLLASGFCLGLAITMKQHAVFFLPFAALLVWLHAMDLKGARRRDALAKIALLFAGAVIPWAIVALLMAKAGSLDAFWFWTVRYARSYVSERPVSVAFGAFSFAVGQILQSQLPFWYAAVAGAALLLKKASSTIDRVFIFGFGLVSLAAVMPGWYFRPHYFVTLLPALSLLAAAAMHSLEGALRRLLPPLILLGSTAFLFSMERDLLFRKAPPIVGRAVQGENPFAEAIEVASWVASHTSTGDRIAVFGSEPEIYFYSGRRAASGYIYMYGLMENHPDAFAMERELIDETEAARPRAVVFVDVPNSWGTPSIPPGPFSDWMASFLANGYELVGVVDMIDPFTTRYVWGSAAASYAPVSRSVIKLYSRR